MTATHVAVDLNNIDQGLSGSDPIKLVGKRVLWDLDASWIAEENKFVAPADGLYNFNGNFRFKDLVNVSRVLLHLYQNGQLWATLADGPVGSVDFRSLQAYCPCDGLFTDNDYFEIYVELVPTLPLVTPTGKVDGSREKTFWGFDFMTEVLSTEIDSED